MTRQDMKKHSISQYLIIGMTAFSFIACTQEEETERVNEPVPLKVLINQSQSTDTRATLSGLSTEFEAGDVIGIYVENEEYSFYYNIPYVFDGSNWNLASGEYIPKKVSFLSNYHYYAYYPYTESLPGWPYYNDSNEDGTCTADEFFENVINRWSPEVDQSTKANFNASDLMVGKGTILSATNGTVSFTLNHKMGLVRMKLFNANGGQVTNISASTSDFFTDANIPFKIGDEFYHISKPGIEAVFIFEPPVDYLNIQQESVVTTGGHVSDISFTAY